MKNKQLIAAALIFIIYCALMTLSNHFASLFESTEDETYQMISGVLFGFIAIPVFGIILPIYLANKWNLDYSLFPKTKNWIFIALFFIAYLALTNYAAIGSILSLNYSAKDYVVHFISAALFHVTYYPLLVIFIFPVLRARFGLRFAVIATAALFALYHLTQYHYFPGGTTLRMQIVLFIAFIFNILLYLWSESVFFVSILHSVNGAVGLLTNGTIFNEIDFLFYLTLLIIGGLLAYYIFEEIRRRKSGEFNQNWWLRFNRID